MNTLCLTFRRPECSIVSKTVMYRQNGHRFYDNNNPFLNRLRIMMISAFGFVMVTAIKSENSALRDRELTLSTEIDSDSLSIIFKRATVTVRSQ